MIYIFGDVHRIKSYELYEEKGLVILDWRNIFRLNSLDILIVTRVWSPFVSLYFYRKIRPKIIQFADGLVTYSNCVKKTNRNPEFLYKSISADRFYVRQPLWSLPNFIDVEKVHSTIDHSVEVQEFQFYSITLIFGNDPYVGSDFEKISDDIENILTIDDRLQVYISSGCKKFTTKILKKFNSIQSIGRMSEANNQFESSLIITSPSTVGYDLYLKGECVMMLPSVNCETLESLFTKFDQKSVIKKNNSFFVNAKKPMNIKVRKVHISRESQEIRKRFRPPKVHFFSRIRYFFGDLKYLFRN